jgi:hypothetical protein
MAERLATRAAGRGGTKVDFIWVLLNASHARLSQVLNAARSRASQRLPGTVLGVNRNLANTQALVKVPGTQADFVQTLSAQNRAAVTRTFTEADHATAVALVTAEAWTGPIEPGA